MAWPVVACAGLATLTALVNAWGFRSHLPMSEAMASVQRKWFLLDYCSAVLFMGENVILGITGDEVFAFSCVLGTELAVFLALMRHFWRQGSRGGMLFVLFWLGTMMFGEAFYIADARDSTILAILREGGFSGPGGRDWGEKLAAVGLRDYCVGLGQIEFFMAWWLMAFSVSCGVWLLWRWAWAQVPE
ncbi:MAG: hypothetical protein HZB91_07195 [Elusimicrobia bacterium]|nr:hypothetical protein [Elusimicrobiota bacterium]